MKQLQADEQVQQALPSEIVESYRRCWSPHCKHSAWFEHVGWCWCLKHYIRELRQAETWGHLWVKIRFTNLRNPYKRIIRKAMSTTLVRGE